MNNINFNWNNNGFIDEKVEEKKARKKEVYASFAKGGIIYISLRHKPEVLEVAIGYDEKSNIIVLVPKDKAPKEAPIRKLSVLNKETDTSFAICASGLVYALIREGKINGIGYRNRVRLGVGKDRMMIYLNSPKAKEND